MTFSIKIKRYLLFIYNESLSYARIYLQVIAIRIICLTCHLSPQYKHYNNFSKKQLNVRRYIAYYNFLILYLLFFLVHYSTNTKERLLTLVSKVIDTLLTKKPQVMPRGAVSLTIKQSFSNRPRPPRTSSRPSIRPSLMSRDLRKEPSTIIIHPKIRMNIPTMIQTLLTWVIATVMASARHRVC